MRNVVGKVSVILLVPRSAPVSFGVGLLNPALAHTLEAVAGPLTLRFAPAGQPGRFGPALCRADSR